MITPPKNEIKCYYEHLQACLLDSRDNRGKRHELAFIIVLFSWSILRSVGQLSLSSIHRKMLYFHDDLALECGSSSDKCIIPIRIYFS